VIDGAHLVLYNQDAEADRDFFRSVLGFDAVDAGHGWLIFSLPPSEAAFHPAASNERPEPYLMCDDLPVTMAELKAKGVRCGTVRDERWGQITTLSLPGGGTVGLYQPGGGTVGLYQPGGGTVGLYQPKHPRRHATAKRRCGPLSFLRRG
jgi:catechol 2,3-dioxygenase-like lactoylglutathione lyase family enzyme